MTMYRAIGKYRVDAEPAEKIAALRVCLTEAACELVGLGVTLAEVSDWLGEAEGAAGEEWDALSAFEPASPESDPR